MEKESSLIEAQSEKTVLLSKGLPLSESVPQLYTRWPKWVSLLLRFHSKFILTVEPVLFLFMFGMFIQGSVLSQYIFNRYGREAFKNELNFSGSFNFCMTVETLDLDVGNGTGTLVSQKTSYLKLGIEITSQFPGMFAALIFGPLSDRIGRRFMMVVIPCTSCASAILIILLINFNWQVELLALIVTLNGIVGGFPGMMTAVYSYVADVSSKRWLTFRIGILESMIFASASLGHLISRQWLKATECNFRDPFFLYFAVNAVIIVYVRLWLPESVTSDRRKEKLRGQSYFSLFQVVSRGCRLFVTWKNSRWWRLWVTTIAMFFGYLVALGATKVSIQFFVHHPLLWLPDLTGYFQAMSEAIHGLCLLVILPILMACHISDALIVFVSFLWAGVSFIVTVFIRETWQMFLVGVIQGVEVIGGPAIRSILSKAVAPEDQGALFSIVAAVQVVAAVCSSVTFLFLFPWTLSQGWPAGNIYFFLAGFCFIVLPIPIILLIFRKGAVHEEAPPTERDEGTAADDGSQEVECETSMIVSSPPPTSNVLYGEENSLTYIRRH